MEFVNKGTVSGNALVVGVNSYVTFEEAMQYIKTYFPEKSHLYTSWLALTVHDQSVALMRSTLALERLMYSGSKATETQTLSFPRKYRGQVQTDVPQDIKYAQIENAVYIGCTNTESEEALADDAFYKSLRDRGITSYRMGSLSESFGNTAVMSGISPSSPEIILLSPNAKALVQKYLMRGANIV